MKEIPLTGTSLVALIDDDNGWLMQYRWHLANGYAVTTVTMFSRKFARENNLRRQVQVRMHRLVLDAPSDVDIDHRDLNKLNNRRSNLRLASRSQNCANAATRKLPKASKYKGVRFKKRVRPTSKQWVACLCNKTIGTFNTELEAAVAYNNAAVSKFGQFSRINQLPLRG